MALLKEHVNSVCMEILILIFKKLPDNEIQVHMLNRYVYYHQVSSALRTNKSLYRVILGCSDYLKLSVNKVIHVYMYYMLNI